MSTSPVRITFRAGGNCGFPDGVIHAHTDRCYQQGRADASAELEALTAKVEALAKDFHGTTAGTLIARLVEAN